MSDRFPATDARSLIDRGTALADDAAWVRATGDAAHEAVRAAYEALAEPLAVHRLAGRDDPEAMAAAMASVQVPLQDRHDPHQTLLVGALYRLAEVEPLVRRLRPLTDKVAPALASDVTAAEPATLTGLAKIGTPRAKRDAAAAALGRIGQSVAWASDKGIHDRVGALRELVATPVDTDAAWTAAEADPYGVRRMLDTEIGARRDLDGVGGLLPPAFVTRVDALEVDSRHAKTQARPYQGFAVKFLLTQRRAILADGIGLGSKTQALLGLAHLRGTGRTRLLIVCPDARVDTWVRAAAVHTDLVAGPIKDAETLDSWRTNGGLGVMPASVVASLDMSGARPEALVVDNADVLVAPFTRTRDGIDALAKTATYVWFLARPMDADHAQRRRMEEALGAHADTDAPVYLRRRWSDVASQLPPLTQVDDWTHLRGPDRAAYNDAVRLGTFSAMRRAAFSSGDVDVSDKLGRLVRLVGDAITDGHRVVVLSYFFSVLTEATNALTQVGMTPVGMLTPATPPEDRAAVLTAAATTSPCVLVAQLADGTDVNTLPGTSVVILCEPQAGTALEIRALARYRTTGRLAPVQVRRLLTADACDEQMVRALHSREALEESFDTDPQALLDAPVEPPVLSEVGLAHTIIDNEVARLGITR